MELNHEKDLNLEIYLEEISKYEILSVEETNNLLKKYKDTQNIEILKKIVNHNLRLAIPVAKKYCERCRYFSFLDLVQECNIALIKSVEKYNLKSDVKFSTYATQAMEYGVVRAIYQKDNIIKFPENIKRNVGKYKLFLNQYYKQNKEYPTDKEIMKHLNIGRRQLEGLKKDASLVTISLNKKIETLENEEQEIESIIPCVDNGYSLYNSFIDTQILLKACRNILGERSYYVIYNRIIKNKPRTLESIGKNLGVSYETIRKIEKSSLLLLQENIKEEVKKVSEKYNIKEIEKFDIKPSNKYSKPKVKVIKNINKNVS